MSMGTIITNSADCIQCGVSGAATDFVGVFKAPDERTPAIISAGSGLDCSKRIANGNIRASMGFRLNIAYGLWALFQIPVIMQIHNLAERQNMYAVCLFAPFLSWHASIRYYRKAKLIRKDIRVWLFAMAVSGMFLAILMRQRIVLSVLICIFSFLMLRIAMTGESLKKVVAAGGILLVFMVPVPVVIAESVSVFLQDLYVTANLVVFELLTGTTLFRDGFVLDTGWGPFVEVTGECSGLRSLLGLTLLSLYYASVQEHPFFGFVFMGFIGMLLALVLNFVRLMLSCIVHFAGESYWSSDTGHALLGVMVFLLGSVVLGMMSRKVVVEEDTSDVESALKPGTCC